MIQKLTHLTIYVLDQERAKEFYTAKLGFEVRHDNTMQGFRWLTVGPKSQPGLELVLMPVGPNPMMDEATAATLRDLVAKGAMGTGVFETDDVHATYAELQGRGVEFIGEPQERPYGTEALLKDDSGNWFSLLQCRS